MTPAQRFDLAGKAALITGGAGILGSRFAAVLLEAGARVAIVDVDAARVAATAEELAGRFGGEAVLGLAGDVADPRSVDAATAAAIDRFGGIDVLLNNAATKSSDLERFFAPFEEYDLDIWREVMAVNVDGMFLMAKAVGRHMAGRRRGSIVQTSSIYGVMAPDQRIYEGSRYMDRPINTPAVYSASKAAVIGLTRYLAAYWAEAGVRVNAIAPGGMESGQNETFKANYGRRVPMGRMGHVDELSGAVLFLASDASSYVTGQTLLVDGGLSVW